MAWSGGIPVLESLLAPMTPFEFRDQYYGKQPLLIRGNSTKFADLFTWEDLNRLLNASSFPHAQVVTTAGSNQTLPAHPLTLFERCRAGASMIFNRIDDFDPKIGAFTRTLEAETGEPMNVNLYLSQPSQAAFSRHYDQHDVFVLHVYGHKAWSVYERTLEKPIFQMTEASHDPPSEPILECELAPGDVLYIPRGHWHQALAQRGLSLHLTLGMNARTGVDFLLWLADEMRSDVRFRHELPLSFANEAADVREARLRKHVAQLAELVISRLADGQTVPSFEKHRLISDRDFRRFKLPVQFVENPVSQLDVRHFRRPAHQRWLLEDGPTEEKITLSAWGHIFHFAKTARPLVEYVFSETVFSYEDAVHHAGELTDQGIRDVLGPLVREGILDAAG